MGLGTDKQYDLDSYELDKVRRRLEIKKRLKDECFRKTWNPYLHIQKVRFDDPAIDRFMDLRKHGRMPGAPYPPKLFFSLFGVVAIPMAGLAYLINREQTQKHEDIVSGKVTAATRKDKALYC